MYKVLQRLDGTNDIIELDEAVTEEDPDFEREPTQDGKHI